MSLVPPTERASSPARPALIATDSPAPAYAALAAAGVAPFTAFAGRYALEMTAQPLPSLDAGCGGAAPAARPFATTLRRPGSLITLALVTFTSWAPEDQPALEAVLAQLGADAHLLDVAEQDAMAWAEALDLPADAETMARFRAIRQSLMTLRDLVGTAGYADLLETWRDAMCALEDVAAQGDSASFAAWAPEGGRR